MAYITTEQVAEIRKTLAEKFPKKDGWKLSVTRQDSRQVQVSIMAGPVSFTEMGYQQISIHTTGAYSNGDLLKEIFDICNRGNHNNSDPQTDYFDVGWYVGLSVGKWNRPFVLTET